MAHWSPVEKMQDLVNKMGGEERIDRFLSGELVLVEKEPKVVPTLEQPKTANSVLQFLIDTTAARLADKFSRPVLVDPLPAEFTAENLAAWAKFNLKPVFLPGEDIGRRRKLKRWKKPEDWFYNQAEAGKVASLAEDLPPTMLRRGWYLADFTVSADYDNGKQVFVDDPLVGIITKLREEGKIGKYDSTPMGSRFAITHDEWQNPLLTYVASAYGFPRAQVRLERAIEFNAIGNIYDANRGKFNAWEWFEDHFEGSRRLFGGHRGYGGLSGVNYVSSALRSDSIAGRPLVSFAR